MLYQWVGTLSSILYLGCLWGVLQQILVIQYRRRQYALGDEKRGFATRSLSVNGFSSSFLAFYSVYVYSMLMPHIDYFLFATRAIACAVTAWVLFELYRDRTTLAHRLPFWVAVGLMIASVLVLFFRESFMDTGKKLSIGMVMVATVLMFQGGLSQVLSIVRQGCTGALSLKMTGIFFLKDLCNVAFGAVLGLEEGWPIIIMGIVSAAMKLSNLILFSIYPRDNESVGHQSSALG